MQRCALAMRPTSLSSAVSSRNSRCPTVIQHSRASAFRRASPAGCGCRRAGSQSRSRTNHMIGPIRPELCLFSLVSAFVHLLRSSINIASVPNAGPARAAEVQLPADRGCCSPEQLDHEGDPTDIVSAVTIWNAAPSVHTRKVLSERGWHPLKQPGVDFAVRTLGNVRSTWTIRRHGVNWHRGVF